MVDDGIERELRDDGVTTLGRERSSNEEDEEESTELVDQPKEEFISELPREEKDGKKCIDPCPNFNCMLTPSNCESNCGRCLDNPCLICTHNCRPEQKEVLLREEYKKYRRFYGGKKVEAIYKEKAVDRRVELMNKKEELEDKLEHYKQDAKESKLPDRLAYFLKGSKVKKVKSEIQELENRISEGEELFQYDG